MSRIGNQPITVTDGVQVQVSGNTVHVKGAQGELNIEIPENILVENSDGKVIVTRTNNVNEVKALHGLTQRLLHNAITGVTKAWEKKLEVIGTGYRVKLQGRDLVLDVGYSHSVKFAGVSGVQYAVQANVITISGADRQLVGQTANRIKAIRKPDPYKGKGIRYEGEVIKLKPGKKAKTA
ncbi:MAG: 50S ribosomal protein L6 [Microgenomates bacterium OLB23]|nr:MAG: 50S ribosomal protein L6 [Microgenomates bacterium OLB23]